MVKKIKRRKPKSPGATAPVLVHFSQDVHKAMKERYGLRGIGPKVRELVARDLAAAA